mgnify:CR=1 FL=1
MNKFCIKCKLDKNVSEFTKVSRNIDRLHNMCRLCTRLIVKKSNFKHKEKRRKQKLFYYQNNAEENLIKGGRE